MVVTKQLQKIKQADKQAIKGKNTHTNNNKKNTETQTIRLRNNGYYVSK